MLSLHSRPVAQAGVQIVGPPVSTSLWALHAPSSHSWPEAQTGSQAAAEASSVWALQTPSSHSWAAVQAVAHAAPCSSSTSTEPSVPRLVLKSPWLRSSISTSTRLSSSLCIFTLTLESSTWMEMRAGCASTWPWGSTSTRSARPECSGVASRRVTWVSWVSAPAGMVSVAAPAFRVAPAAPTFCAVEALPPPQAAKVSRAAAVRAIRFSLGIMMGSSSCLGAFGFDELDTRCLRGATFVGAYEQAQAGGRTWDEITPFRRSRGSLCSGHDDKTGSDSFWIWRKDHRSRGARHRSEE